MPKQRSHSGTKKRFWLTSTGKVKRPHGGKNHKAKQTNKNYKTYSSNNEGVPEQEPTQLSLLFVFTKASRF